MHRTYFNRYITSVTNDLSGTNIDHARCAVLQIDADAEVEKVVDRVSHFTELVNGFFPVEVAVNPLVAHQNRPAAQVL